MAEGLAEGLARARAARAKDRYRYVFVVTYGRSGSTLLQGLINTLPRTLLRGENDLYVQHLVRALTSARRWREEHADHGAYDDTSAFYGLKAIRPFVFAQAVNDVVTQSLVGKYDPADYDVVGFKEVLWHRLEPAETEDFFTGMDEAFPGARYVLNTRAIDDVIGSGFWKRADEQETRRLIDRIVNIQEHLRQTRPERVFDVRYEVLAGDDAVARDEQMRGLAEFVLDRRVDEALMAALHATRTKAHGPKAFERADKGGARPPGVS